MLCTEPLNLHVATAFSDKWSSNNELKFTDRKWLRMKKSIINEPETFREEKKLVTFIKYVNLRQAEKYQSVYRKGHFLKDSNLKEWKTSLVSWYYKGLKRLAAP